MMVLMILLQAAKMGKNGRRSSIMGGFLANTVAKMWPFNRTAAQAAAAGALPEDKEAAEEAAMADVDAAAGGLRISPRLQQVAGQASPDGEW